MNKRRVWGWTVAAGTIACSYFVVGQAGGGGAGQIQAATSPLALKALSVIAQQEKLFSVDNLNLVSERDDPENMANAAKTNLPEECPANAFQVPGQAWKAGLTAGGITLNADNYKARSVSFDTIFPKPSYSSLSSADNINTRPKNILLVVADHLDPTDILLREDGYPLEKISMRHGQLVVAHIRSILESVNFINSTRYPLTYRRGGLSINILPLEVPDVNRGKASVIENIEKLIDRASISRETKPKKGVPFQYMDTIITMSFSVLSCRIFNDYKVMRERSESTDPPIPYNFQKYLIDLMRVNPLEKRPMQDLLTEIPKSSDFAKYLTRKTEELRRNRRTILVASSGNFGIPFSTAPGSGSNIISVGATDWNGDKRDWSSTADVMSVGEWFTLNPEQLQRFCDEGETCIAEDIQPSTVLPSRYKNFGYRGTSFATPSVAVFLATRIGNNPCFNKAGSLGFKPLQSKGQDRLFQGDWIWQNCP